MESNSNNFTLSVEPDLSPPDIFMSSNSAAIEFDHDMFYVIEKLENVCDKSIKSLPNYYSAILNCAPIKINKNEDIEVGIYDNVKKTRFWKKELQILFRVKSLHRIIIANQKIIWGRIITTNSTNNQFVGILNSNNLFFIFFPDLIFCSLLHFYHFAKFYSYKQKGIIESLI